MENVLHVAIGGGGALLGSAAALTRAQVDRIPVPPMMCGVRLLVVSVVLLRLVEEFGKGCDVHGRRTRLLPFATGKPRRDFLEQPTVPVRILARGERKVGTAFRVVPGDARVLRGVVERPAGVMEDLADADAAADQIVAGSVDVIHGEDQLRRTRPGRRDSLAEDDRRL